MTRTVKNTRKSAALTALLLLSISVTHGFRPRHHAATFSGQEIARGGAATPNDEGGRAGSRTETKQQGDEKTLEKYVAAMEQRDNEAHDDHTDADDEQEQTPASQQRTNSPASATNNNDDDDDDDDATVGVKSHGKKSNAVGDPDSDSSDDEDDEETDDTDWLDLEEILSPQQPQAQASPQEQVQVEVEVVQQQMRDEEDDDEAASSTTRSGGGVGVRSPRQKRRDNKAQTASAKTTRRTHAQAWLPHIYLPPAPKALSHVESHASASSHRLDRRTLYASLLQELQNSTTRNESSRRKFLDPATSQSLQAALSLATQPQWRQAAPQSSGVVLYNTESPTTATLSMQETVMMALAHSLGCGMVILDDAVLSSVRKEVSDDSKSAALLESLLQQAREGSFASGRGASVAQCLERDLTSGLDDPYDERAVASCQDMTKWEQEWQDGIKPAKKSTSGKPLPLVIFVRTETSKSLLKSKSAMEQLMQECTSADSVHMIVLGKGIDARTVTLPDEPAPSSGGAGTSQSQGMEASDIYSNNRAGAAPWFGFAPKNQNASGQNDPDGSRRFNIFLARTVDPSGTPGILGAIAEPQAGNLFPHMLAMQARERLQNQEGDSPLKDELERWAHTLQQQMQTNGGMPLPPPQFFNASLSSPFAMGGNPMLPPSAQTPTPEISPPPEVVQQALQQAMNELLDRLAQMNEDESSGLSPELHKSFRQVLQNENLRRGIAENLARAAPALTDPKCQGVMLSVYVPPPPSHMNRGKLPGSQKPPGGWFQKILNNNDGDSAEEGDEEQLARKRQRDRVRTAAAAMVAAKSAQSSSTKPESSKSERHLAQLESLCRHIPIQAPSDPVRAKAWDGWVARERGAVVFRHNRRSLNSELEHRTLSLERHTGTRGAGSALRQMLSVRSVSDDMEEIIKCAVELEAGKSRRQQESENETLEDDLQLDIDVSLSQLLVTDDGIMETAEETMKKVPVHASKASKMKSGMKMLHPSSLEAALSAICRISPSPAGGLSVAGSPAAHRSRDDIMALAQDKHERALISQVVSPQDIGVTYDMIGGLSDVKELLRQSITYPLKFPHLYSEGIAREAVKGVLLFGPPGTGKTMLAKAVATEGGASFLSVDASSIENKWLGESEKNSKAVFTLARRLAPCVIFIDEVDSLLSSREGSSDDSAHGTLTSVKTTMMSEWDGLNSGTNGAGEAGSDRVVVIGSTNRPFDLDEAVLRRFPRRILVDLPDLVTRTEILEVTLAENRVDPAVNLTQIAERLDGYTGSDIKEVCREAVVQISHEQARLLDEGSLGNFVEDLTQGLLQRLRPVTMDDFERALNKLKRSVSEKGRELARVYEWNDEYGELSKKEKNHLPQLMNMYL